MIYSHFGAYAQLNTLSDLVNKLTHINNKFVTQRNKLSENI